MRRQRPDCQNFHRTQPLLFHRQAISYSLAADNQYSAPAQVLFPDDTFCFGRIAKRTLLTEPVPTPTGDSSPTSSAPAPAPAIIDDAEENEARSRVAPIVLAGLSDFRERYPKVLFTGMSSLFAVALQAILIVG